MYLTLPEIKKHLNIDEDFKDDDVLLLDLASAAENLVQRSINQNLSSLENEEGDIPSPLKLCALTLVATHYADRESVNPAAMTAVPHSFEFIIDRYMNYFNPDGVKDF